MNAKYLSSAAAALAVTAALSPAAASASPYHRHCENAGAGAVIGKQFQEGGPFGIRMSASNAARIARDFPPGEFGSHEKTTDVPCFVTQAVGYSAGKAWLRWRGNSGTANVVAFAYGGNVHLGRFHCAGRDINQTVHMPPLTYHEKVAEVCTQGRGPRRIIATFRIETATQS